MSPNRFSPNRFEEMQVAEVQAGEALDRCDPDLFQEAPGGHFWLEHLVHVLADGAVHGSARGTARVTSWRLYAVERGGVLQALYSINTQTRYAMFHCVDTAAGGRLLRWALEVQHPEKVLAPYAAMESVLTHTGLHSRITRDHRELFMVVRVGGLLIEPDWRYRVAGEEDIPRLVQYNRLYNAERQTRWTRDWARTVRSRVVYVREQDGVISSCLLRGAILPPLVSFGGMFTFPEYRGRGDAAMLIANFCAEMALSNLDVCLIVDDDNTPALRTYSKVGFMPAGLYRTTYFG